jgi:hypothetical protein
VTPDYDPKDLVGTSEIATRLSVAHGDTVRAWRRRHDDFPDPVMKLGNAVVWFWPDVEAWARETGRL